MSRIGKQPIKIPDNVQVVVDDGRISAKGPKGDLSIEVHPAIKIENANGVILLKPQKDRGSSAIWGLTRALVANMIEGVTRGYAKKLEVEGVGYRAQVQDKNLVMQLGFSHPVEFNIPEDVSIGVEGNVIEVSGVDKQQVGQVAAKIRGLKKPEPYKGKGIRYEGERIRRKVGKKAAAA